MSFSDNNDENNNLLQIKADSSSVSSDPSLPPASESVKATLTDTTQSMQPSTSQTAACSSTPSTPGTGQLPVGSQALRDLMELAEDGMTLTQCGYTSSGFNKGKRHQHLVQMSPAQLQNYYYYF